jgi:hypothetical protein
MTARENRKARREAERKARKQEKKAPPAAPILREQPTPQSSIEVQARLAKLQAQSERELEAEFGQAFLAHARATGDRIARRAGLVTAQRSSFRNMPQPPSPGRSTGPRTPEGKVASSRNSLKHGLSTGTLLIHGEDPAAFEAFRESLRCEHQPADATEQLLVDDLAQSHWLRQRALRLQNDCFTADGGVNEKRLALFLRYGTAHERAFHKALSALLRLQKERRKTARAATSPRPRGFVSQNDAASSPSTQFVSQNAAAPQLATPHHNGKRHTNSPASGPSIPHAA